MKTKIIYTIASLTASALAGTVFSIGGNRGSQPCEPTAFSHEADVLMVAPGRIEPISEQLDLTSDISGKLKEVLVDEGGRVERGQVLAVLENVDYQAQVAAAEARLRIKQADWQQLTNGARVQERRAALAAVKESEAISESARSELERSRRLLGERILAAAEVDHAEREYQVAEARHEAAGQRHALLDNPARPEDRARAEAEVALAQAQLEEAQARLEKTFIRSPLSGTVLRKHRHVGENVTASPGIPILTVADASALRVRIEVDETEVARIQMGQRAYVTADAYGNQKFWGQVVRIGQVLGRKSIHSDEPSERVDTQVLEALVQLDEGCKLQLGLRVNASILRNAVPSGLESTRAQAREYD